MIQNSPVWKRLIAIVGLCLAGGIPPAGYGQTDTPVDLYALPLEDLLKIKVTSVSRKEQSLKDTPAAVFVVTQEDIRRSGYTTLPEVLRMVPGLQVARISGTEWAITARGFNGRYANKLLVLLDGRPIYSPTFSGVFWEYVDVVLEDIDRIEVIRGPGATMWGANAVNGVISIFTRRAGTEHGGFVSAQGGDFERQSQTARWEDQAGKGFGYRVYCRDSLREQDFATPLNGGAANGPWHNQHAGGRIDWQATDKDSLSVEAEGYRSAIDEMQAFAFPTPPFGAFKHVSTRYESGDVTLRWNHKQSETSEMTLQFFYDQHDLDQSNPTVSGIGEGLKQADLDMQYRTRVSPRHELIWGAGFRYSVNDQRNSFTIGFLPAHRADPLYTAFVQDEISLIPNTLLLTLGSKIEHNNYTGMEVQPGVQLFLSLDTHQGLWASVSRAVSTPARNYTDLAITGFYGLLPTGLPTFVNTQGNPDAPSEKVMAYETGYRLHAKRWALDAAGFFNRYNDVKDLEALAPIMQLSGRTPQLSIPLEYFPTIHGSSYGLELSGYWNPTNRWRLSASDTLMLMDLKNAPVGTVLYNGPLDGSSPTNQFQVHSGWDLTRKLELDTALYHVGRIGSLQVPSYTTVDAHIGWKLTSRLELGLAAQNLLNESHLEFVPEDPSIPSMNIGRTANVKLTWRF